MKQSTKNALVNTATTGRYILAESMARNVKTGENIGLMMGLFVVADVFDGILARSVGAETAFRRGLDAVVDRASVIRVAFELSRRGKSYKKNLAIMAITEGISILANTIHTKNTGEVVHSGRLHKLGSLTVAAFGVSAVADMRWSESMGHIACTMQIASAIDYVSNSIAPRGTVSSNGIRYI